jgi:hypothetical protein
MDTPDALLCRSYEVLCLLINDKVFDDWRKLLNAPENLRGHHEKSPPGRLPPTAKNSATTKADDNQELRVTTPPRKSNADFSRLLGSERQQIGLINKSSSLQRIAGALSSHLEVG